jgi:Skp family chaperone for outer membrane proteins
MAHDVFISYSSQDKPVADAVCAAVEAAAVRCWIAPRDVQPGRSFSGEITRAIQRSKVMVLIFSAHSNASEQVLREVQLAANAHLHIVQFRIQDVVPSDDLEYYLSTPHWLDALSPPLEAHLGRLEKSVKALLEMTPPDATPAGTGPILTTAAPTVPISAPSPPAVPPEPATAASISPTPVDDAAAAPFTSTRPERRQRFFPATKWWIVATPIALFVIAAAVLFSGHLRSRHPAATGNVSVTGGGRDPSFAFVDMNRVFKGYSKTKDAEAKINDAKQTAKVEYDRRADAYKKLIDEINNLNEQLRSPVATINTKAKIARERDSKISDVKNMEREIKEFRATREKELQDDALRKRGELVGQITAKIKELGGSKDNFIIDSSGNSLNGVPFFFFTPQKADMSDRVISALNTRTTDPFLTTRGVGIAVVDMNAVFKNYNKTKSAEATINQAKNSAKQEYDTRADAYKSKLAAYNAMQSGAERDQTLSELKAMEREINDFRTTREKQLQEQALRLREGIVKEIEDFISQQYIKDGESVVLDVSGTSLNGVPLAVFWRNLPNLTNEIISGLNGGSAKSAGKSTLSDSNHLRFGLVDMDRAFKVLPETKQAEAEIDAAKEKAKTELGPYPDATARAAKDKELQSLASEKRAPIVKRMTTDVSAIAEARGFDIIFDSSGNSLNGVPAIVVDSDVPDLTEEVIARAQGAVSR